MSLLLKSAVFSLIAKPNAGLVYKCRNEFSICGLNLAD